MADVNTIKNMPYSKTREVYNELVDNIKRPICEEIRGQVEDILDDMGLTKILELLWSLCFLAMTIRGRIPHNDRGKNFPRNYKKHYRV